MLLIAVAVAERVQHSGMHVEADERRGNEDARLPHRLLRRAQRGAHGQGSAAVQFKVPLATTGDVLARYLVRVEELKQSIHIIDQLIDDIPTGPMNVGDDSKLHKPDKSSVYGSIEGLIQHFELVMTNRKWEAPVAET